jgi:hypothetical protein
MTDPVARDARTFVTAAGGVITSAASPALVLLPSQHPFNLIGALLLACVVPGAGLMCWCDSGDDAAQVGLTLTISLAVFALLAALMIWLDAWHPRLLVVMAALSGASCLTRLWRSRRR